MSNAEFNPDKAEWPSIFMDMFANPIADINSFEPACPIKIAFTVSCNFANKQHKIDGVDIFIIYTIHSFIGIRSNSPGSEAS